MTVDAAKIRVVMRNLRGRADKNRAAVRARVAELNECGKRSATESMWYQAGTVDGFWRGLREAKRMIFLTTGVSDQTESIADVLPLDRIDAVLRSEWMPDTDEAEEGQSGRGGLG